MDNDENVPVSYAAGVLVVFFFLLIIAYLYTNRHQNQFEREEQATDVGGTEVSSDREIDTKPLTAKQRKKQELKEAKQRQRILRDEEREEKNKKRQERQDYYQQRREEKERQRQEDEIKRAEREYEAYKDIVSSFVIEKEGHIADHERFNLDDFINFVRWKKMTNIVDLSAKFEMPQNEVVERLNQLEAQGRLFGLLDERGRYLHISASEVDTLENYINKGGRIHKYRGLTPFCNAAISMQPTHEDLSKLQTWEQNNQRITMEE
ncbi:tRNA nucleotidyltransferase [Babesia caballi]|uniref:tRNA nucleotidyltransferase n=1 Tax=Babesia caballi TaxID=5871 RepID=A0AAV4LZ43_BABCB|nr:tRNA nucleotidyltransferase [Babesia caballi]